MGRDRNHALDGIRGIAAICVVLTHSRLAALHGYLAVDLFFVLSGYVIAQSYERRLRDGSISLGQYLSIRIARLYPMMFVGAIVGVSVHLLAGSWFEPTGPRDFQLAVVSQFLLIPALSSSTAYFAFNNPPWSIVWELVVNFLHASGLKNRSNWVLATVIVVSAIALAAIAVSYTTLDVGSHVAVAWAGLPRATFGFFAGVLLCRTSPAWSERVPRLPFAVPVLLFLLLVNMPPQWIPHGRWWGAYDAWVVIGCAVPLLMLTARAKGGRIAAALGTISYPLYAINEPVVFALVRGEASAEMRTLAVAMLVLVAWALGRWVDEPLNAWRRRRQTRVVLGTTAAAPA